jgi:hypothetical protein
MSGNGVMAFGGVALFGVGAGSSWWPWPFRGRPDVLPQFVTSLAADR